MHISKQVIQRDSQHIVPSLDVSHICNVDTPKEENTRVCRSSIQCVAVLSNVSLTQFGECAEVRIHC